MQTRGPWTIISTDQKYANKHGLKVVEHKVIRPDGKEGIYGVAQISPGAYVLPLDDQDMTYLTKQFRFPVNAVSIETVSGAVDAG